MEEQQIGLMSWPDLTVPDAPKIRDFYGAVIGWKSVGVDMGGYEDYVMMADGDNTAAGIVHAKGVNADLPPMWVPYFLVADVAASVSAAVERGAVVISEIADMGEGQYCILRDPAGAAFAVASA